METASKSAFSIQELAYIAMGTALIAVCAWICIPTTVPFTLQTFAIFLVTGLLGFKCGVLCVGVYLLLGLVGVPVFAGFQSGIAPIFGATGGYLFGFLLTAAVEGLFVHFFGRKLWALAVGMALGCLACYALGTVWYQAIYLRETGAVSLATVLGWCVIPYLPFDAAKLVIAVVLVNRIGTHVKL